MGYFRSLFLEYLYSKISLFPLLAICFRWRNERSPKGAGNIISIYYILTCAKKNFRLSAEICDRLDQMERESWEDYRWKKHQLRKEALGLVEELAERKSMRGVKRSEKEQNETRERHLQVIENY